MSNKVFETEQGEDTVEDGIELSNEQLEGVSGGYTKDDFKKNDNGDWVCPCGTVMITVPFGRVRITKCPSCYTKVINL